MATLIDMCYQMHSQIDLENIFFRKLKEKFKENIIQVECEQNQVDLNASKRYVLTFIQKYYQINVICTYHNKIISIKFKIQEKCGKSYRISSQYQKTLLLQTFLAKQQNLKHLLNPVTGQLCYEISWFCTELNSDIYNSIIISIEIELVAIRLMTNNIVYLVQGTCDDLKHDFSNATIRKRYQLIKFCSKLSKIVDDGADLNAFNHQKSVFNKKNKNDPNITDLENSQINAKNQQEYFNQKEQKKIFEDIARSKLRLDAMAVSKKSKTSNYQKLIISKGEQTDFIGKISQFQGSNTTINLKQTSFGRISLRVSEFDCQIVNRTVKILEKLDRKVEYEFLQNYFCIQNFQKIGGQNQNLIYSLALKRVRLKEFFYKNSLTMSIQTKMKIFLQILNGTTVLWQKNNIILHRLSFQIIQINRNMSIKMSNLTYAEYVFPEDLVYERNMIAWKRMESLVTLCFLYFKIFYNKQMIYTKPGVRTSNLSYLELQLKYRLLSSMFNSNIHQNAHEYGPKLVLRILNDLFLKILMIEKVDFTSICELPNANLLCIAVLKCFDMISE